MVHGLYDRLPHHPRRAGDAVEARVGAHFQDGRNAAAFFAHQMRPNIDEFDFGRGVGAVAELVLQPLDVNPIECASGQPARHEKTYQTADLLRTPQVAITRHGPENPLWPGDAMGTAYRA